MYKFTGQFVEKKLYESTGEINMEMNTIKLLGAAFLFVFVASLLSESLLKSVVGSGGISDILVNISKKTTLLRISILVALINSLGIVALASLLYIIFNKQYPAIALIALGLWLVEAVMLAVSKLGANALISLSQEFIAARVPETSHFQTLGNILYSGVDRYGYMLHNLFFSLGGILWYYLFFTSRVIPVLVSGWGLVTVSLLFISVLLTLYDRKFTPAMVVALPYLPYEIFLGVWLIVKGFN